MKGPFYLVRDVDATGISGTGRVAEGYVFEDGTVTMRWLSELRSTGIYDSLYAVEAIHGHNGQTRIEPVETARAALIRVVDRIIADVRKAADRNEPYLSRLMEFRASLEDKP